MDKFTSTGASGGTASAGVEPAAGPGAACRSVVEAATAQLLALTATIDDCDASELAGLLFAVDCLGRAADASRVALVAAAVDAGVVTRSAAASAVDWVLETSPSMVVGEASRLVKVAAACREPRFALLSDAVLAGRVPVRNAGLLLGEYARLVPDLVPEAVEPALGWFVDVASQGGPGQMREVRELRPRLIAKYGAAGQFQSHHDDLHQRCAAGRGVTDEHGMTSFTLWADPEGAAFFSTVMTTLSTPAPGLDERGHPVPDERPAALRRYEALLAVLQRGVAAAPGPLPGSKAQVVVTMGLSDLVDGLHGSGVTLSGELLAPGTVRRLACDAGIVPLVLGGPSEPLDVGQTKRLFTGALVKAMWFRDKGCTFPGCTRPPQWCEAHHIVHWCDGGATTLSNGALLCSRHHHVVHARGLTATVDADGVTWHT